MRFGNIFKAARRGGDLEKSCFPFLFSISTAER